MIRVDSLEQYKKLRDSGFTDDIMVLMKGGEDSEESGRTEASGETGTAASGEAGETKETEESRKKSIQFDYDKVVEELEKRLIPVIQKKNRENGSGLQNQDDDLDTIMKKFAEM